MTRQVRSTLVALGVGAVAQRAAQLLAMVLIGRALGIERTGQYALGLAAGGILAALASAGVRTVVSREVVRAPERTGDWIRAAVRARLWIAAGLYLPFLAVALLATRHPTFWALCGLLAFPAAFDLKGLLDSAARTGREVVLETATGLLHLVAVAVLLFGPWPTRDLGWLVGAHLAARVGYALGAALALRGLPRTGELVSVWGQRGRTGFLSVTQTAHGLVVSGDVWLVHLFGGPTAAGLYAVAQRLALAAGVPAVQLARLLLPHSNRAATGGDPARTVEVGLRAVAYTVLPLCVGGWILAEGLCGWFGSDFVPAAPALRGLLLGMAMLYLGFPVSQALFARGDTGGYAGPLWLGALGHAGLLALCVPLLGSAGAGVSAAVAHGGYLLSSCALLRRRMALSFGLAVRPALAAAAATGGAAFLAEIAWPPLSPWVALMAGALAAATCLWFLELQGSWRRVGEGLTRASGFGQEDETVATGGAEAPELEALHE